MNQSQSPHVAVIGAGAWGHNHVRVLKQLGVLGLVIDTNPRIRSSITDEFGIPTSSSIDELSQFPNITAAVVATPAESHTAVAAKCLELGLDLLVEKPLALTAADAMDLCESADASNRILMVGHLLLFHPAVQALHSLV